MDGGRRPSTSDRPGLADVAAQRALLGDIGARPSLSDLSGRLGHYADHHSHSRRPSLTDRRSSGDYGSSALSVYRQPSLSSRADRAMLERQRTLRTASPSRYDGLADRDRDRPLRSRSPSRYEHEDPFVRNLSPVRYDGGRSPSRSRQGSDPDLLGLSLHGRRGEVPTRDWSSGMLSPKWPDSRAPSPRGAAAFFPETESLQSLREAGPDRLLTDPWTDDHLEGPSFLMEHEIPTRERDADADSHHSGDMGRYETRL